ncbi:hypothetical protein B0H13DRAFT_2092348 [Mycena leptocephala]|nr:hypothetical protein B0H13DRAFT_2092348 [Mycena leptocephala]
MTNAWAEYRVPQYQHVADEVTPVAAAYLIMALALRGSGRAIGLHHSLRFKYAVFLVIFQLGCVIRMLSKNSFGTNAQLMTGRLLAGSGAAGMFTYALAGIVSQCHELGTPYFWHFQYAMTVVVVSLPLLSNVFLPAAHLVFCFEPLYTGLHAAAFGIKKKLQHS